MLMKLYCIFYKFLLFLLIVFLSATCPAFAWEAKVIGVADGDTITVFTPDCRQVKIRLYGIDCPERRQAFGNRARQATQKLVDGKTVDVQSVETDRYGRTVGIVSISDGITLNESLVRDGFAWVYPQYCRLKELCDSLRLFEATAKANRLGLWEDKTPIKPWEWRKQPR
jgi:endonuclease YncB( thermonuclease family)